MNVTVEKDVPEISYELMEGIVKYLQGKVLTVIEASVIDQGQLTAAKSLVKGHFNDSLTRMFEVFMYHEDIPDGQIPKYE